MEDYKPLLLVAYDYLKDKIINSELDHDTIYSETSLSREIGVSRTPFREAISRLVSEKYIDIIPNKGFRLHKMTDIDVIETFQVRSALEGYCVVQIANASKSDKALELFAALDDLLESQDSIAKAPRTEHGLGDFVACDNEFHIRIIDYLGNKEFIELFHAYLYRINRLARLSLTHEGRMEETVFEHRAILNTMRAGDSAHIYEVTMRHMDRPRAINLIGLTREP